MHVPPEERDFSWALAVMRNDYAMRRKSWPIRPEGHHVYMHIRAFYDAEYIPLEEDVEEWCLELVDGDRVTKVTTFSASDVLAYDWEVYGAQR